MNREDITASSHKLGNTTLNNGNTLCPTWATSKPFRPNETQREQTIGGAHRCKPDAIQVDTADSTRSSRVFDFYISWKKKMPDTLPKLEIRHTPDPLKITVQTQGTLQASC
jgi:hypothetical protein